jgi:hypothetical protein
LHRGPAGRPAAASEQDHHDQGADKQPVDPSPYDHALYGRVKSVERENARDPAYAMLTAKMQRAGFEKNGLTPGAGDEAARWSAGSRNQNPAMTLLLERPCSSLAASCQ